MNVMVYCTDFWNFRLVSTSTVVSYLKSEKRERERERDECESSSKNVLMDHFVVVVLSFDIQYVKSKSLRIL